MPSQHGSTTARQLSVVIRHRSTPHAVAGRSTLSWRFYTPQRRALPASHGCIHVTTSGVPTICMRRVFDAFTRSSFATERHSVPACFTRVSRNEAEQPPPHDSHVFRVYGGESRPEQASGSHRTTPAARIPTHATPTTPLQQTPHARHSHPHNTRPRTRTTRGGRARKEEWGHGR